MTTNSLKVSNLAKYYAGLKVLDGLSFELKSGNVIGLLGPNGAGKTTALGMIYGSVIPDSGKIELHQTDGNVQSMLKNGHFARTKVGIVTQHNNLDPDLNVFENLIYYMHHFKITGKPAKLKAGQLLERVALSDHSTFKTDELSGGMKRRLVLARALVNEPKILLLDEPTTGLDPQSRQDLWRLIVDMKNDGCGILLTTHYMDEAQRLCGEIILLNQGKQVNKGSPAQLIEQAIKGKMVELNGVDEISLNAIINKYKLWSKKIGAGFLLEVPINNFDAIFTDLNNIETDQLIKRLPNLEDVFLKLN